MDRQVVMEEVVEEKDRTAEGLEVVLEAELLLDQ
jgi:hypothetical protein